MSTKATTDLAIHSESTKSVADVCTAIEAKAGDHGFRVLHTHDVQATLAEKGFKRSELRIVEICSAPFAHQALSMDVSVSLFMPCRYTVYAEGGRTHVMLARPSVMGQMIPHPELEQMVSGVEKTLTTIMEQAV